MKRIVPFIVFAFFVVVVGWMIKTVALTSVVIAEKYVPTIMVLAPTFVSSPTPTFAPTTTPNLAPSPTPWLARMELLHREGVETPEWGLTHCPPELPLGAKLGLSGPEGGALVCSDSPNAAYTATFADNSTPEGRVWNTEIRVP